MQNSVTESIEPYQKLFDEMFKRFNLSAKDMAEVAGISEVMVSRFRREKSDMGASRLIAILFAVPADARRWYLSELFGEDPGVSLRNLILKASPTEQADALRIIADLLVSKKSETPDGVNLVEVK